MRRSCKNCYFCDNCDGGAVCGGYSPLVDIYDEQYIHNKIESERKSFYKEWYEYMNENDGVK